MDIQIRHDTERQRFETRADGASAYMSYTFRGDLVYFDHTYVPPELRGQGVAAALVRAGLEEARRQHWKVVPSCSYVDAFIRRNPEYEELVA